MEGQPSAGRCRDCVKTHVYAAAWLLHPPGELAKNSFHTLVNSDFWGAIVKLGQFAGLLFFGKAGTNRVGGTVTWIYFTYLYTAECLYFPYVDIT